MTSIFSDAGMVFIVMLLIYGIVKITNYRYYKYSGFFEDKKVYAAAEKFVGGASSSEIVEILASCLDFDRHDANKILSLSVPFRSDSDGGYRAFITAVNRVLGVNVYRADKAKEQ